MSTSPRPSVPWGFIVAAGAVSLVAGIVLIFWPGPSLQVIGLIVGIDLVCLSAVQLCDALFSASREGQRAATTLLAVIELIAGLIVLKHPGDSLAVVAIAVGICFVVAGVVRLFALEGHGQRGGLLARALVDLGIGVVLVAWPDFGLKSFAVVAGIGLVVHGIVAVVVGLGLRRAPRERAAPPPATPRLA